MKTLKTETLRRVMGWLLYAQILVSSFAMAQDLSKYPEKGLFKHINKFEKENQFISLNDFLKKHYQSNKNYGFKIISQEQDALGFTHYRLQQTLNDIPIEKSMLIIHVKEGMVKSVNGEWFKNFPHLKDTPAINEQKALDYALNKVDAQEYLWQTKEAIELKKTGKINQGNFDYSIPKGTLVYISENNNLEASSLKLAYKFDVFATQPMSKNDVYVDAHSGKILFLESQIHQANEDGIAQTGYYGNKPITIDQEGDLFYTRQTGNRSIELFDMKEKNIWRPTYLTGETMESNSATFGGEGNAKYYIDVYWGAEVTHDFYNEKFNRNSYNNAGSKISLYVNGTGNVAFNNAYWIGTAAYFGNATSGTPLTSLDIVAHEITHGVTRTSANLTYRGESGALNESFSDIFGAYAEHYASVGDKWTLGEYIFFKRSMSNPNEHNQPDTYLGDKWFDTSSSQDNGGVHYNSGVMNYWFYLISEGGSGTNDNGDDFTVNAIGIEKAAQIAYRTLTNYLTQSSGYTAAREAVINSAKDLYGSGSCEVAAVTDAMHAVGVGESYNGNCGNNETCADLTGLNSSSVSQNSALVSWNAVSGISNYNVEYKKATDTNFIALNSNTNSISLTELTANTTYNVRVRYTCVNGIIANYVFASFTTESEPLPCNNITGLDVSNISTISATISWNEINGVNTFNLEYKKASDVTYSNVTVPTNSKVLTDLTANTNYEVRVNYTCEAGETSEYSNITFTTEENNSGSCDEPDYVQGQFYNTGDRVVYEGIIYEAIYNSTYWSPASGFWNYIGPCDNDPGGCGVAIYMSGQIYNAGDQVVFGGKIYQAQNDGTHWSPEYGFWTYIGECTATYNFDTSIVNDNQGILKVYPNPTSIFVNVSLSNLDFNIDKILILDLTGKIVLKHDATNLINAQSIRIDISGLKEGIYFIKAGSYTRRLKVH